MKIISISVVPMPDIPVTIRTCSRKPVRTPQIKDTITQDVAARPYNEQFARALSGNLESLPITFDSTVGTEWQRGLK